MDMFKKKFLVILAILAITIFAAIALIFDNAPFEELTAFSSSDVKPLIQLISSKYQHINDSQQTELSLTEQEVNLLLRYFHEQNTEQTLSKANITDNLILMYSYKSALKWRPFINTTAEISSQGKTLNFVKMTVGKLPIPKPLLSILNTRFKHAGNDWVNSHGNRDTLIKLRENVENLKFAHNLLTVTFKKDTSFGARLDTEKVNIFLGNSISSRMKVYQEALEKLLTEKTVQKISLAKVFRPLFALAHERSLQLGNAAAENQALIAVLALHNAPSKYRRLLISGTQFQQINRTKITLEGKVDYARHFLISALVAQASNDKTAEIIALHKELEDEQGLSGFDIKDLLADQAGTKFAKIAASKKTAEKLQLLLHQKNYSENYFMPPVTAINTRAQSIITRKRQANNEKALLNAIDQQLTPMISKLGLYQDIR